MALTRRLAAMTPPRTTTVRTSKVRDVARRLGFRSGLEKEIAAQIEAATGLPVAYEDKTPVDDGGCLIEYEVPARMAKYTADFRLPNGIIVETKGRFVTADRKKHKLIKEQRPDLDIRIVFNNPNARISKTSKTTYAKWCETHGIPYAKAPIPSAWFKEPKR
jgi:hypothetical protein